MSTTATRPTSQTTPSSASLSHRTSQGPAPTPTQSLSRAPKRTIYDRNLNRTRHSDLNQTTFALLFNELISYSLRRVTGIADLERRLNTAGYPIGLKLLPLLLYRNPALNATTAAHSNIRPTNVLGVLQFVSTTLWKHLFGKPADALERSQENKDEYMITDNDPVVNSFISVPKEMSQLNCAAFVAGIVEGVCDASGMQARVSAHSVGEQEEGQADGKAGQQMWPGKTIFLVKFEESVIEREEIMAKTK